MSESTLSVLELCAGAGGQAIGLERAGFAPVGLIEIDDYACATLTHNRPAWPVVQEDLRALTGSEYEGVDLLAAGVPCPPFSIAGKQLGDRDERNLFPATLRLVKETRPRAVLLENVRGLATRRFESYRQELIRQLEDLGYICRWTVLNAADYGVPQLRPRWLLVALRPEMALQFEWPAACLERPVVGDALRPMMAANGWRGARRWAKLADRVAPTLVGGSMKHGGPDLGPTRAKQQWAVMGVDAHGIANEAPGRDFAPDGMPRLTIQMVSRLQGFPPDWIFSGGKTAQYRQIGNAFPPPVAAAVTSQIAAILSGDVSDPPRRLFESRWLEAVNA